MAPTRLLPLLLIGALACGDDPQQTSPLEPAEAASASATALTFVQVAQGAFHSCEIGTDERAYCWGENRFGQLGDGTNVTRSNPTPVAGDLRFTQLSLGHDHSCGLTTDKLIYCWGFNWDGQLGEGTSYPDVISRSTPAPIVGNRRYIQVRSGSDYTCAIATTKEAFCWGRNTFSELGRPGVGNLSTIPIRVAGNHAWRQLKAGDDHTCGVTTDDRAYCWGSGFWGNLGNGSMERRDQPTAVAGGLKFRQITVGWRHTCAVTPQNRVYCWGDGEGGQLGIGAVTGSRMRLTPVAVATDSRFDQVMAGEEHTCAVALNDRAFCWGSNSSGQLGDGTRTTRFKPVAVKGGLRVRQLSTHMRVNLALTTDGRTYWWGMVPKPTPVPVMNP